MIDETSASQRPGRSRRPLAAALAAVAVGALAFTVAVAGGLSGPAPGAAVPSAAPAEPAGVPSVEQGGSVVDAGWLAPSRRGATTTPAFGGNGRGRTLGDITITKVDGARLSLETEDGWTRTIDATGVTITRGGTTIVVGALAVGDTIVLRQARRADGTFTVTAIRVILPKLAGTVTGVAASSLTLTTRDGTKVTVKLTSSTTYRLGKNTVDKSAVKVGMQAVATGTKAADGTLTATSVTVKASQLAGTVAAVSGTTITITARDGSTVTAKTTTSTTYRVAGVKDASLVDVKVDMWIVVAGLRNDDGSITASTVRAAAAGKHKGWGDWKPNGGRDDGSDQASPAPAGAGLPLANG